METPTEPAEAAARSFSALLWSSLIVPLSSLIRLLAENAAIWANGGMGNPVLLGKNSWKFGGGGGGRIFLRYSVLECGNLDVIVA